MKDYVEIQKIIDAFIELATKFSSKVKGVDLYEVDDEDEYDIEIYLNKSFVKEDNIDKLLNSIEDKMDKLEDRDDNLFYKHLDRNDVTTKTYVDEERKILDVKLKIVQCKLQCYLIEEIQKIYPVGIYGENEIKNLLVDLNRLKEILNLMMDLDLILDDIRNHKDISNKYSEFKDKIIKCGYENVFNRFYSEIDSICEESNNSKKEHDKIIDKKKNMFLEKLKSFNYKQNLISSFNELFEIIRDVDLKNGIKTSYTEGAKNALLHYKPTNIKTIKKITGLNPEFIDVYGEEIIKLFKNFANDKVVNNSEIFEDEYIVLEKLKNRLVNINQRNRLLYTGKLQVGKNIDLVKNINNSDELLSLICSGKTTKFCIYEFKVNSDGDIINESLYRNLNKLERESKAIEKEKGSNVLYIAYPYVEGKLQNDDFYIKAPLVLFPVDLIREKNSYYVVFDESRDVIFNTTLLLANNKANNKNLILPNSEVEDFSFDNLIENVLTFYSNNHFEFSEEKDSDNKLEKFRENKMKEFPKYQFGELYIKNYLTLGVFPNYVTSIYDDFQKIIDNSKITTLLRTLLSSIGAQDEKQIANEVVIDKDFDQHINCFGKLDYSQERIMKLVRDGKSLVIQGPPGTGKSQTIANIVVQAVIDKKNILMVSEKKAALDVIYSRLGNLSNFAILLDDMEDKNEFFTQIRKIVEYQRENYSSIKDDLEKTNKNLKTEFNKLEVIESKIYRNNDFGLSIEEILHKCRKYDFSNSQEVDRYEYLQKELKKIFDLKYDELFDLYKFYQEYPYKDDLSDVLDNKNKYKWISKIKSNLTDYEIVNCEKKSSELLNIIQNYTNLNFVKKMFEKKNVLSSLKEFYDLVFSKQDIDVGLDDKTIGLITEIKEFLPNYTHYFNNVEKYNTLSSISKIYFGLIYKISIAYAINYNESNNLIYNHCLYRQIEQFKSNNSNVLNYIDTYDNIITNIDNCFTHKEEIVNNSAGEILINEHNKLSLNNNIKEIERQINKKRFINIKDFIDKYKLELMDSVKIWLMTPEVVSSTMPLDEDLFDIVIFDEASQLFIEKTLPAIYRAKQIVIAGDDKQLKPSLLGVGRIDDIDEDEINEYSGSLEEESLLGLAKYRFDSNTLNFHYRAKYEELINFSNFAFYDSSLAVSPNRMKLLVPPIERIKVENGLWNDKKNDEEAKKVIELIKEILTKKQQNKTNETIGIITFNSSQKDLIYDMLELEKEKDLDFAVLLNQEQDRKENGEDVSIFVKNIENVQGDERDIIIFSTGYAKGENGRVSINFGWLNQDGGENRLNVAISRAKQKIYVVTSVEPEELKVDTTKNRGPKLFRDYLSYVKAISSNNIGYAKSILNKVGNIATMNDDKIDSFDSEFEEEVCQCLRNLGYKVETQVGTGNYRIDLAILDDNNNYIVGIECDGRMYHSSMTARERDYYRQKFLESRGWKIYRIWSTKWWDNKDEEIKKLDNYIKNLISNNKFSKDEQCE